MGKTKSFPPLFICLLITALTLASAPIPLSAQQNESITITTYYPAPYGVYFTMEVNNELVLGEGAVVSVKDPATHTTVPVMRVTSNGIIFLKNIILPNGQDIVFRDTSTSPATDRYFNAQVLENAQAMDDFLYDSVVFLASNLEQAWITAEIILAVFVLVYPPLLIAEGMVILSHALLELKLQQLVNNAPPEWWP